MAKRGRPKKEQPVTDVTPETEDSGPVPGQPEPGPYDELQGHQPAAEHVAVGGDPADNEPASPSEPDDQPADEPAPEPEPPAEPVPDQPA